MVDHDLGVNPFRCERRAFQGSLRKLEPLPNLDFRIRRSNSLRDTIDGEAVNLFRAGQGVSGELGRSLGRLIDAKHNFYAARKAAQKRRWRLDIYDCLSEMADFHLSQIKNEATGLILDEGDETKVAEVQRMNEALTEVRKLRAQIREARRAKATPQTEALERLQGYFDDEKTPTFVWELDFAEVFFRQTRPMTTGDSLLPPETTATSKEVVKRGGIDLMLGNPPYVRIQTLKKQSPEQADYYKQRYVSASKGNYELHRTNRLGQVDDELNRRVASLGNDVQARFRLVQPPGRRGFGPDSGNEIGGPPPHKRLPFEPGLESSPGRSGPEPFPPRGWSGPRPELREIQLSLATQRLFTRWLCQ
jgi:hypothetical protein